MRAMWLSMPSPSSSLRRFPGSAQHRRHRRAVLGKAGRQVEHLPLLAVDFPPRADGTGKPVSRSRRYSFTIPARVDGARAIGQRRSARFVVSRASTAARLLDGAELRLEVDIVRGSIPSSTSDENIQLPPEWHSSTYSAPVSVSRMISKASTGTSSNASRCARSASAMTSASWTSSTVMVLVLETMLIPPVSPNPHGPSSGEPRSRVVWR